MVKPEGFFALVWDWQFFLMNSEDYMVNYNIYISFVLKIITF